jgi:hypothetical protein
MVIFVEEEREVAGSRINTHRLVTPGTIPAKNVACPSCLESPGTVGLVQPPFMPACFSFGVFGCVVE